MNHKIIYSILFLFISATISGCANQSETTIFNEEITGFESLYTDEITATEAEKAAIFVSIQGEVANPGVYLVPSGSRIYELINQAGGVTDNADTSDINMVFVLEDGMQVIIPGHIDEQAYIVSKDLTATLSEETSGLININIATLSELMTLPGIGETRAKAIIDYREKGGHFDTVEDIKNVSGIKNGIYNGLKDSICVK